MPPIKSLASECRACTVVLILLLGVIMPMCFYYTEKKLVCVIIAVLFSYQPSSCSKCIKLNMYFFCNIRSVFNAKYAFFIHLYSL